MILFGTIHGCFYQPTVSNGELHDTKNIWLFLSTTVSNGELHDAKDIYIYRSILTLDLLTFKH
jgi:hypothetical protein